MQLPRRQFVGWLAGGLSGWLRRGAEFFGAVAVGAVSKVQLRRAIKDEWEDFARMDEAEPGLMGWEREFYFRFIGPGDQVLVVGCGSGRDVIALLEAGVRVTGVDIAPEAVERCRCNLERRGLSADLIVGPAEGVKLGATFDRIIFSWFCYSYIQGAAERVETLRNMGRHLRPRGQVLLSYLLRRSNNGMGLRQASVARLAAFVSGTDWRAEVGDEFIVGGPLPQGLVHFAHRFDHREVEAEAREAGLTVGFHEQRRHGVAMLEVPGSSPRSEQGRPHTGQNRLLRRT